MCLREHGCTVFPYPVNLKRSSYLMKRKFTQLGLVNDYKQTRPRGYKTVFMLNSAEHEIKMACNY